MWGRCRVVQSRPSMNYAKFSTPLLLTFFFALGFEYQDRHERAISTAARIRVTSSYLNPHGCDTAWKLPSSEPSPNEGRIQAHTTSLKSVDSSRTSAEFQCLFHQSSGFSASSSLRLQQLISLGLPQSCYAMSCVAKYHSRVPLETVLRLTHLLHPCLSTS